MPGEKDREIRQLLSEITHAAEKAGAVLIDAKPVSSGYHMFIVEPERMADLIRQTKPRLVITDPRPFDIDEAIEAALTDDDDDENDEVGWDGAGAPQIDAESLRHRYQRHNGEIYQLFAGFVIDGALYGCFVHADWYDLFIEESLTLETEGKAEALRTHHDLVSDNQALIREKAEILAKDPLFSAKRASFAKRCYLAERRFPDIDPQLLPEITERAENISWLAKAEGEAEAAGEGGAESEGGVKGDG